MTELDELMSLDPIGLTKDSPELEAIIANYRNRRAALEAGVKPKRGSAETKPKIDLSKIMANLKIAKAEPAPAPKSTIARRV